MLTSTSRATTALQERCLDNVQIPGCQGLQQVWIDAQGQIAMIQSMDETDLDSGGKGLDLGGDWLSLGGVDLQINGALGLAFPELTLTETSTLEAICQFLWQQGIDGFLPTVVTTSVEKIHQALETIAQFRPAATPAAEILGVHLEGPFLNPEKRGAHPGEFLLPLTVDTVQQVLAPYANWVKVITLAPELDPSGGCDRCTSSPADYGQPRSLSGDCSPSSSCV